MILVTKSSIHGLFEFEKLLCFWTTANKIVRSRKLTDGTADKSNFIKF